MSVFEATERELEELGPRASGSTLAATALVLAQELDGSNSATSKSMCAKSMIDVMRELRALAPPREERDDLSKLRDDRAKRRARFADAADSPRS